MKYISTIILLALYLALTSCGTTQKLNTLRDVDVINIHKKNSKVYIKPKSTEEIRAAYLEYLENAKGSNSSRMTAITRLAEIEFDLTDKLMERKKSISSKITSEAEYNIKLDKTISLLTSSLNDYPNEKRNDKILYQLAKAYEQRGLYEESIKSLNTLTQKYPKSPYYIESQFRIGEAAFSRQDYVLAEDAYTEVISSKKNEVYFEKSTFKRAWARYKQNYYIEAVDDVITAIKYHHFSPYEKLSKAEKSQYDEYYRTIGLSFAYAGGIKPLNNYMKTNRNKELHYPIYLSISKVYKNQQRYSDAAAILSNYIRLNKKSSNIPYAYLEIMNIWNTAGFSEKLNYAANKFYLTYNPSSRYWLNKKYKNDLSNIKQSFKKYLLIISSFHHQNFIKKKKNSDFALAQTWYLRFLKHYKASIQKENANYLYAELLSAAKIYSKALTYYEKSAYDNNIILNKNAAYATIITTNKLLENAAKNSTDKYNYIQKHLNYAQRYVQLYPNDKRNNIIILHASEVAAANKQYQKAITLTKSLSNYNSEKYRTKTTIITAQSHFQLKNFKQAEELYTSLLSSVKKGSKSHTNLINNIALAIYKQGDQERYQKHPLNAANHYKRIAIVVPHSKFSSTGLVDAIAIYMQHKKWLQAITSIKKFQSLYPSHEKYTKVSKNLSIAYLNSNQSLKAAKEFEKISTMDNDNDVKKAALLQAAQLYEDKSNIKSAIHSYQAYIKRYPKPYTQYIESLNKLYLLNKKSNNTKAANNWRNKIIRSDKQIVRTKQTDRSKYIVSSALLSIAQDTEKKYHAHKLIRPLKRNLRKKKKFMQSAIQYYGRATIYKNPVISSQATFSIASLYLDFSKALLNAELPLGLSNDEKEQYKILLEDRAFPFEEKAIEFYEVNMEQTLYNQDNKWIKMSYNKLKELFPVRYNRKFKIDELANALH